VGKKRFIKDSESPFKRQAAYTHMIDNTATKKTQSKSKKKSSMIGKIGRLIARGLIGWSILQGAGAYLDYKNPYLEGFFDDIESKYVIPAIEEFYEWKYEKLLTDISNVSIKRFESFVAYYCFNEKTGQNDREFFRKGENMPIPINEFNLENKIGILAVEDPYYMYFEGMDWEDSLRVHNGIDWPAIIRAGISTYAKGSVQGGSTITLQMAKKLIPGHDINDRVSRLDLKIEEMALASDLERILGKLPIFGGYLNGYYIGNKVTGQGAAMKCYFGHLHPNLAKMEQILTIGAAISNPNPLLSLNKPGVLIKVAREGTLEDLTEDELDSLNTWRAKYNNGVKKLYEVFHYIDEEQYKDMLIENHEIVDFLTSVGFVEFEFIHKDDTIPDIDVILNRHIRANNWIIDGQEMTGTYLLQEYPGKVEVITGIDPRESIISEQELMDFFNSKEYHSVLVPKGTTKDKLLKKTHPVATKITYDGWIRTYFGSKDMDKFDFLAYVPGTVENNINTGSVIKPILMYFVKNIFGYSVDHKWLLNKPVAKDKKTGKLLPNNHSSKQTNPKVSIKELLQGSWNRPTAWIYHTDKRIRGRLKDLLETVGLERFHEQDINNYSISLGVDIEAPLAIPALYSALLTDGVSRYPKLVELYVDGVQAEYANPRMRELYEPKVVFPSKEDRKAILFCLDEIIKVFRGISEIDVTIGKTGSYGGLEGSVTTATSYLGQNEPESYEGVATFFVNFRKEEDLNDSVIGISTKAARPALEKWVRADYKLQVQRAYNEMVDKWFREAEDSDNALYESKVKTLFQEIIDGKHGEYLRIHEIKGAMEQVIKNYQTLISEEGMIRKKPLQEMFETYSNRLDRDRFIF
jgi:hypothetical protein